jgi:hypothetical protein
MVPVLIRCRGSRPAGGGEAGGEGVMARQPRR